jgi:origin recognition complex subunit 5
MVPSDKKEAGITSLPQLPKFIPIASFLASTNPPESDLRIFGRGLDEKKKRN